MKLIKKAWSIGNELLTEDSYIRDFIYLGTRNEARAKFWREHEGIVDQYGDEIEFLNINMVRAKYGDVVEYKGKECKRWQADSNIRYEARMLNIETSPHKYFLVQDSRSYTGNAVTWWGIDGNGYTLDPMKAHRYSKLDITSGTWRDTDLFIPLDVAIASMKIYCDAQLIPKKFRF